MFKYTKLSVSTTLAMIAGLSAVSSSHADLNLSTTGERTIVTCTDTEFGSADKVGTLHVAVRASNKVNSDGSVNLSGEGYFQKVGSSKKLKFFKFKNLKSYGSAIVGSKTIVTTSGTASLDSKFDEMTGMPYGRVERFEADAANGDIGFYPGGDGSFHFSGCTFDLAGNLGATN